MIDRRMRQIMAGTDARLRGLASLAKSVFLDRNAQGMPKRDRLRIKAAARPHLRAAIGHARKSRDALLAGNESLHECERDRARMYVAFARIQFFLPYANEVGDRDKALAAASAKGGESTKRAFARPDLDDVIRGCLQRGEPTKDYVARWSEDFGVHRSTIHRHIKKIEAEK